MSKPNMQWRRLQGLWPVAMAVLAACGGAASDGEAQAAADEEAAAVSPDLAAAEARRRTSWTSCAPEGGTCAVPSTRLARYGANGTYAYKTVTGSIACTNAVWGDPVLGVAKSCAYSTSTTATAPAPAPPAPTPAPPAPAPAPPAPAPAPPAPAPAPPAPAPAPPAPAPAPPAPAPAPPAPGPAPACTGVLSGGTCYPLPPAAAPAGKQWQLTFQEEFDGSSLNTSKLSPCPDWNYGGCSGSFNTGREAYALSQVKVSGGTGKLIATPAAAPVANPGCYQGMCDYQAGLVSTARPRADNGSDYLYAFTYGYVEARLKVPATRGIFTAFWMLPASPDFTYNEEIDILEMLGGDTDTAFMTYHYGGRNSHHYVNQGDNNNGACAVKEYSTAFSTFGVDWQPGYIAWYIDGVKCGQYTGTTAASKMFLILNLMVDNQWERDWGLTTQNKPTDQLEVDYIRVYQQR